MACDCIETVNAKLAEHNTRLVVTISMTTWRAYPKLLCEKINTRKRDMTMIVPSFCPFCSAPYDFDPKEIAAGATGTQDAAS